MKAITPSAPNGLKSLAGTIRPSLSRVSPGRLVVQSVYRSDSVNFPNGVGLSRADWQSSCAILASKVVSQEQSTDKPGAAGGGKAAGGADHVAAVNGHKASIDLDLVPISTDSNNKPPQLAHRALTITDLSPAPMHESELRVAYQGVLRIL
ncbi:hypothetical protein SLA2020_405040 [Shorea laevis]